MAVTAAAADGRCAGGVRATSFVRVSAAWRRRRACAGGRSGCSRGEHAAPPVKVAALGVAEAAAVRFGQVRDLGDEHVVG
jgi:hypothetical protein